MGSQEPPDIKKVPPKDYVIIIRENGKDKIFENWNENDKMTKLQFSCQGNFEADIEANEILFLPKTGFNSETTIKQYFEKIGKEKLILTRDQVL